MKFKLAETPLHPVFFALAALSLFGGLITSAQSALITRQVNVTLNATNADSYNLDLDQNGTDDFVFETAYVSDIGFLLAFDQVSAADNLFGTNSGVLVDVVTGDGFPTVTRLTLGDSVSPAAPYSSSSDNGNLFFTTPFDPPSGNFSGQTGFVGLRFVLGPDTFYGFAQVTVFSLDDAINPSGLFIGQVGFNDVTGQPVVAVPEPASMALLAMGITGVFALRRASRSRALRNGGEENFTDE